MIHNQIKNYFHMKRNLNSSFSRLITSQNEKLKNLISYAYENVPYYRELFDRNHISPQSIENADSLRKIPITTKKKLQSLPLEKKTSKKVDLSSCIRITTSGSTGVPLEIFYLKNDYSVLNMNWIRPLLVYGVKPWQKRLEITGPHNISDKKKWYQYFRLWRSKGISIFNHPSEILSVFDSYKPDVLYGYSGSLKLLAEYSLKNKITTINPKYIFGVSDLLDRESRDSIVDAFHKEVIDLYGAAESGCIAWECHQCKGFHINMDTVIVECINKGKSAGPGKLGKIVITNLYSYAMPFIRYDLDDIGLLSSRDTSCGVELPLMDLIEGRSDAFIVLPSGDLLSPMFFFGIMKPIKNILNWRVCQKNSNEIIVYLVPDKEFNSDMELLIRKRIKDNIKENIRIRIKLVKELQPDKTGKVRSVISSADHNWY